MMSGEDSNNNNNNQVGGQSNKRKKEELTHQEKMQIKHENKEKTEHHLQTKNMLNHIVANPEMLQWDSFTYLRQFVATVACNPDKFHWDMGDNMIVQSNQEGAATAAEGKASPNLTVGYIKLVASRGDTSTVANEPILQVVERETKYRNNINMARGKDSCTIQMQFTHLTLCDGDGNIIVGRVVAHLTHDARKLGPGDIIQLPLFTELTHRMGTSEPMPAVFIADFRKIGYGVLPSNLKTEPLICGSIEQPTSEPENTSGNSQKDVSKAKCEYGKRLCSVHGIQMINCICESHPVRRLNLNTLKEDCYFAKDAVDDMTNSQKRCMIYWWYATNIYSICGKKNRMQLPDCLVNAVRTAYPEESGVYEGFSFGSD